MQLLVSLTSPYARKLRMLALELGLDVEVVETPPMEDGPALHAANPLGKVPVLLLDDGTALYDSAVISGYMLSLVPGQTLQPTQGLAYWHARTDEALADGVLDASYLLRLEASHGEAGRNPLWPERYRRTIVRGTAALAAKVSATETGYLELCTMVAVEYLDLRFPEIDWRGANPALAALHARLKDRASLVATRPPA